MPRVPWQGPQGRGMNPGIPESRRGWTLRNPNRAEREVRGFSIPNSWNDDTGTAHLHRIGHRNRTKATPDVVASGPSPVGAARDRRSSAAPMLPASEAPAMQATLPPPVGSTMSLMSIGWLPPLQGPLSPPRARLWLRYTPPGAPEALYMYVDLLQTYQGRLDIAGPDDPAAIDAREVTLRGP